MNDVQNYKDKRGLAINEVGVTDIKMPLKIKENSDKGLVIADVNVASNLLSKYKGTHMSRYLEILEGFYNADINTEFFKKILSEIIKRLDSNFAKIELSFYLFLKKCSPISKKESSMDYKCNIVATQDNDIITYTYIVKVPIVTLCPCSKEISKHNAHNQRAQINLKIKTNYFYKLTELINIVESQASSELYSVIKRPDEKFITEKMYENPKFVEDIVRDIAVIIEKNKKIISYSIKCKSFESIHNHNAYALIKK